MINDGDNNTSLQLWMVMIVTCDTADSISPPFLQFIIYNDNDIATWIPIARQRLDKQVPTKTDSR
jgi:hypothetical protein